MLALTMGDPAGIGGEIALKAWQACRAEGPAFMLLADSAWLAEQPGAAAVPRAEVGDAAEARRVFGAALPVLRGVTLPGPVRPGHPDGAAAAAVTDSIALAVRLAQAGEVVGVVTNPISKAVLKEAGFAYPGHTEYLAALTGTTGSEVMMLAGPSLRVVPVTVHVSLRAALDRLDAELIVHVGQIAATALRTDFGVHAPRVAVAGLNPHAGEGGHLGTEEIAYVAPAVARLRAMGVDATGPWPPDTMFTEQARAGYDAALCLYHDQALIPLKTLDMARGVNVTLGLPIVRTSPDHGTAFDRAGKGTAEATSLVEALRLCAEIGARRAAGRSLSLP